ncbi:MAG: lytic murein transglycosylase [Deferrisomatales bacterium]|nr:lytic murein transglycosylase [Deferrisomatales bacterium]
MRLLLVLGLLLWSGVAGAEDAKPEFGAWLQEVRVEALGKGISAATLDAAFAGVEPIARVVELDRSQPELTWTLEDYLNKVIPQSRIDLGRKKFAEHRALLEEVGAKFGVQPRFIVAFWGIETNFGSVSGGFRVVNALVTLAYDGRRGKYFRGELMNALRILEDGHTTPDRMMGSWAGAMGQVQFMPSSFLNYAVDYDGDGRKDIWGSTADAFASGANYLAGSGWQGDQTWGREVRLPEGFDRALLGLETTKGLGEWQALGVRRADGRDLPRRDLPASIVQPEEGGRSFAAYANYRAILKWNRSHWFALAVGKLADGVGAR